MDAVDVRHCPACGARMRLPAGPRPVPECTGCGRLHHLDPSVGVGAVVRDRAGRLPLVRRGVEPGRGRWALPAGYVDAGEDPRAAAEREVLEETGLVARCGAVVDAYPGGGGASFFLAFAAELVGGELQAGDDAIDARFFALDELPELAFDSTRDAVRRLSGPLATARTEFDAEVAYLDTATAGLPPRRSWQALQDAQRLWRAGRQDPVAYDEPIQAARGHYAALVGTPAESVAIGSQASVFAGLVAASLPAGAQVLTATGDFTSILFPFLAQQARGVTVREVPLAQLAEAVTSRTHLVSVSAVQSADGRLADTDALAEACAAYGTRVLLDTTQAVGWLPVQAQRFAYTVCGGYKWLLAPRGTAYLTVAPELVDDLLPHNAGWYAGEQPWQSTYGSPLRLAAGARRFDVSPAWHSWVAAAPSLELLREVGTPALHAHALGLANRFRAGVGLPPGDSAIVSSLGSQQAPDRMRSAGVVGSVRAGRLRLSFHVSNGAEDVDRAVAALAGHVTA